MKIGDTVFVHGYVDEIRKDTIIIRNDGGYFGTVPSEVIVGKYEQMSLIEKEYALEKAENQYYLNVINEQTKNEIIKFIKSLPSADVQPVVHGEWIDTGSGQECSVCGEIQYGYDSGRHYCANCGVKMKEKSDVGKSD